MVKTLYVYYRIAGVTKFCVNGENMQYFLFALVNLKSFLRKIVQDKMFAYSISCDLTGIAKKRKKNHCQNYRIYGNLAVNYTILVIYEPCHISLRIYVFYVVFLSKCVVRDFLWRGFQFPRLMKIITIKLMCSKLFNV